jgi:hypothetical protein
MKREYAGCYTNGKVRIERSADHGGWNVSPINDHGEVQNVLDNLPTKREAIRIYG